MLRSPSDSTKSSRRTPRASLDSRNGERIPATILAGASWRVLVTDAPNPTSTGSPKPTALLADEFFRWVEAGPPATNPRTVAGVEVFEDRLPSGFVATYFVAEQEPYVAVLRRVGSRPFRSRMPESGNERAGTKWARTSRALSAVHSPAVLTGVKGLHFAPVRMRRPAAALAPSALRRNRPRREGWTFPPRREAAVTSIDVPHWGWRKGMA